MSRSALQRLADPFFLDVAPDEAVEHPAWCEALAAARTARSTGIRAIALVGDGIGRSLLAAVLRSDGLAASTDPFGPEATEPNQAVVPMRKATPDEIGTFLGRRLSAAGLSANLIENQARRLIAERAEGSVAEASRIAGLALAEAGRAKARRVRSRHVRPHLPRQPVGTTRSRQPWAAAAIVIACCAVVPLRNAWLGTDRALAPPDRTAATAIAKPADLGSPAAAARRAQAKEPVAPAPMRRVASDTGPIAPAIPAPARLESPIAPTAPPAPLPARLPAPLPAPLSTPLPAAMPALPPDAPPPVVIALRFDQADPDARERASRLAHVLSALGAADIQPIGVSHALPEAVGYRFGEDRGTALAVGRAMEALDDRRASIRRDQGAPDRTGPGMIDVSIGG